jgi:uncharacterized protein (TIGR03437 family)
VQRAFPRLLPCLAALTCASFLHAQTIPDYTQSSIVHAASSLPGALAPNTIATVYGVNLAQSTRALGGADIRGNQLPTVLPGTTTAVLVGGLNAPILYVSPGQVNFLVPVELGPGPTKLIVTSGNPATISIASAAPGLFLASPSTPAATDLAGRLISTDNPAIPGQWVILYATGLGISVPFLSTGELATTASRLVSPVRLWLGTKSISPAYAGVAPGYAGLNQINFLLPADTPADPEIRIETADALSPPGIFLPVRKPN